MEAQISRTNNFDLIRLFAALQVLVGHVFVHLKVDGYSTLLTIEGYFPGVLMFFTISGFLITYSLDRNRDNIKKYFVNGTQKIFNAKNALCSFATSKVKICLRCTLDCFQFSDISRRRPKYALRGISTRIFHRALKLKRRAPFFNCNNI